MIWVYIVALVLGIYAVVDCLRTPTDELPGHLPKFLWLLLILLLTIIGPIAWLVISWASRAEKQSSDGAVQIPRNPLEIFNRGQQAEPKPEVKEVPPDENPDFLFALEAQIRRQQLAEAEKQRKEKRGGEKEVPVDPEDEGEGSK